jgi:hypothetical protein
MIKCLSIGLVILLAALHSYGQTSACDSVYTIVEEMPVYGKGMSDLYDAFGKVKFSKECGPQDLRMISWVVDKEGRMIDIEVLNGQCEPSIVNQLAKFRRWTPAKHGGKNVCVRMTWPVHIRG